MTPSGSRVCVVGSVNLDQTMRVRSLPLPGQTVLAASTAWAPGGKGGNQAVAAARAGADVHLVAAVGDDDAAHRLRAHLAANAVGLDGIVTVPGPSGTAVILVDDDAENSIVVAPGANARLDLSGVDAVISHADVVLLQLEIPLPVALDAARLGRAAGALVILNASPSAAPDDLADLESLAATVDVVVVNDTESRQWRWRTDHLVITRGAAGATYRAGTDEITVAAPAVTPVDTTGAGDVFAGVLAADWRRGPREALRRACAAGALATLVEGAGDCASTTAAIDDALEKDRGGP